MTLNSTGRASAAALVRHATTPLVLLRHDYLEITERNYCAAKILAVLEHWMTWLLQRARPLWVRLPLEDLEEHLLGEHKKTAIAKAIALLLERGFIQRQRRSINKYDRAWHYQLQLERVQAAVDSLTANATSGEPPMHVPPAEDGKADEPPIDTSTASRCINRSSKKNLNNTSGVEAKIKSKVELPRIDELKRNRVDVRDEGLLTVARRYLERLPTAVDAWLEWALAKSIDKPTVSLKRAIANNWQPEKSKANAKPLAPPPEMLPEHLEQIKAARARGDISEYYNQPWGDQSAIVVNDCKNRRVLFWWEFLELSGNHET